MHPVADDSEADVLFHGIPMRLTAALESHCLTHHAACGAPIMPMHGWTWDQLATTLEARFPPHLWWPGHWDRAETSKEGV